MWYECIGHMDHNKSDEVMSDLSTALISDLFLPLSTHIKMLQITWKQG